jgi:hypothetical protein
MNKHRRFTVLVVLAFLAVSFSELALGQNNSNPQSAGVPRMVKFSGVLKDASGNLLNGTVGISFAVYAESTGGAALWEETQNVPFSQGRYTVLLGQSRSTGIPAEIFSSGQPRWLGVRILAPGEEEQSRAFLSSVPYALKAVDADTVGGLPPSAFLKANPDGSSVAAPGTVNVTAVGTPNAQPSSSLTVTTPGGTAGTVPEFSSSSVIENSPIKDSGGVVVMKNLENVRFADQFPCPSSPGCRGKSDFGAQVNAAYTSCPSTGCKIRIPAGSYAVSTPISFTTSNKPVVLECDAGTTENAVEQGTTELRYTGTSGAAITMSTSGGAGSGIRGCALIGPGFSGANTAIGLMLNSDVKQSYRDLFITGFYVGVQFGSNVYLDNFYNLQLLDNRKALYTPPGVTSTGENIAFFGGTFTKTKTSLLPPFSTDCVDLEGGSAIVMSFYNISFDQCGITLNISGGQEFLFSGSHIENSVAPTSLDLLTIGSNCISCHVILSGSDIYEGYPTSGRTELISMDGGSRLTIVGGIYLAAESIPQAITSTNYANAVTVLGADKFNAITQWVSGSFASFVTMNPRQYQPLTVAGGPIILGGSPTVNGSIVSAPLSASRTWTFPDATGTVLLSNSKGANVQSKRVSGCLTAPTSGATCTTTVAWDNPFADTNYTVACNGAVVTSGVPLSGGLTAKTLDSVTFQTVAATAEAAHYATVDCVALHE